MGCGTPIGTQLCSLFLVIKCSFRYTNRCYFAKCVDPPLLIKEPLGVNRKTPENLWPNALISKKGTIRQIKTARIVTSIQCYESPVNSRKFEVVSCVFIYGPHFAFEAGHRWRSRPTSSPRPPLTLTMLFEGIGEDCHHQMCICVYIYTWYLYIYICIYNICIYIHIFYISTNIYIYIIKSYIRLSAVSYRFISANFPFWFWASQTHNALCEAKSASLSEKLPAFSTGARGRGRKRNPKWLPEMRKLWRFFFRMTREAPKGIPFWLQWPSQKKLDRTCDSCAWLGSSSGKRSLGRLKSELNASQGHGEVIRRSC